MKTVKLFLASLLLVGIAYSCAVQEKASRDLNKEVRQLESQGWKPLPATPSIQEQVAVSRQKETEIIRKDLSRYVIATGTGKAPQLEMAKAQAMEMAKQEMAAQMKVSINSLVDYMMTSEKQNTGETASTIRATMENRVSTMQRIGRTTTLMELYREIDHGRVEVLVRLSYDLEELLK